MSLLDTLYRALRDYRKNTLEDRELAAFRKTLSRANPEGDRIEVVRTLCHIQDDWIDAIEKGLEHIGKAIEEDRQFISSNGEVIPIEKVKSTSRESVEHLAKHSNLLTKEPPEGEDIIPDKLYTVERLTDYAVYENRFLYMLLCYLRDFIAYRYDKILELVNTYRGNLRIKKHAEGNGRKTDCEVILSEEIADDPFLKENNPEKQKIDRIDDMLKCVYLYLSTPLMESVSKAPRLRPPITETNVLKMNKHFRGALQLYYYITAYEGDGFTVEQEKKTVAPFREEVADEFAESIALCSFLAYQHGMGIEDYLKERFLQEEERRRQAAAAEALEKLEKMRRRIGEAGGEEEYIALLEQRVRMLEGESVKLNTAYAEIDELKRGHERLETEKQGLISLIEEGKNELSKARAAHKAEVIKLGREYKEKTDGLIEEHRAKTEAMQSSFDERVKAYEEARAESARELGRISEESAKKSAKIDEISQKLSLTTARNLAMRKELGRLTPEDDFTSEESFNELEHEFELFKKLFREEWRKAKRHIRRTTISQALKEVGKKPQGDAAPANKDGQPPATSAAPAAENKTSDKNNS